MEDPRNITTCMHLHFMAKNTSVRATMSLDREQVIYLVTALHAGRRLAQAGPDAA